MHCAIQKTCGLFFSSLMAVHLYLARVLTTRARFVCYTLYINKKVIMLTYFCLPSYVLVLLKGKPYVLHVLSVLCAHRSTKTNNSYLMSIPKIAKIVGISIRKAYDCIDELMELNLIEEFSNHRGEKMFHLLFLDTRRQPTDSQERQALEAEWAEFMREMEECDVLPDKQKTSENDTEDLSLKQQLKEMDNDG